MREENEREKRRVEEAKRRQEEEERLRLKKLSKKAAQKAKKLAAKGITAPMETDLNKNEDLDTPSQNSVPSKSDIDANIPSDPVEALEYLKVQHLKELQDLQLLHRHQVEEEHNK